jgi:hypothetical protein
VFDPINEVLGVSVCFIVPDHLHSRMIFGYLKASILVPFAWFTFKYKERLTTINTICEDDNLESSLPFVPSTSCCPQGDSTRAFVSVSPAFLKLKSERCLVHIRDF